MYIYRFRLNPSVWPHVIFWILSYSHHLVLSKTAACFPTCHERPKVSSLVLGSGRETVIVILLSGTHWLASQPWNWYCFWTLDVGLTARKQTGFAFLGKISDLLLNGLPKQSTYWFYWLSRMHKAPTNQRFPVISLPIAGFYKLLPVTFTNCWLGVLIKGILVSDP